MTFTPEQIEQLGAKLDASHVKARSQAGRQLSYIEGWHAIAEANRIFGFGNWDRETVELRTLGEPEKNNNDNWVIAYMAKVRIQVHGEGDSPWFIIREGCGFGSGFSKNTGDAHESAIKEAETDAMKRALMTFGNQFGLALYDKKQENVERNGKQKTTTPFKPPAVTVKPDPEGNPAWLTYDQDMRKAIDGCKSIDELLALGKAQQAAMKNFKKFDAEALTALVKHVASKRAGLEQARNLSG